MADDQSVKPIPQEVEPAPAPGIAATQVAQAKPTAESGPRKPRERVNRPFPSASYEEAEAFARQMYGYMSGQPVRRLSFFDHIGKSPDSSQSREILSVAAKYGLSKGSYKQETIELTDKARLIFDEATPARDRAVARVELAIKSIAPFNTLYSQLTDLKLPPRSALLDAAKDAGVPDEYLGESVDTFVVNLKAVGLLQSLSGAERIVAVQHMLDAIPTSAYVSPIRTGVPSGGASPAVSSGVDFSTTCFYITPIGDEGSEFRKHSDLFLNHIVEPALEQFDLSVVRADQIGQPGIISRQIFEYIVKSKLVVVDLSFHNPNVFYELAVRHMLKKPVVQITRQCDAIPFDINQMRTVVIDNSDIYSFVPRMELFKAEISSHVRRALENDVADNPLAAFYAELQLPSGV